MKAIVMMTVLWASMSAVAAAKVCICEVGTEPASQRKAFSIGCGLWLKDQKNCDSKQKVDFGTAYSALPVGTTELAIGYVGHWYHSEQLIHYLEGFISPLFAANPSLQVSVDNTACSAMNRPPEVFQYVRSLSLSPGQALHVRGYQTESLGKWDVVLGKGSGVWAAVSSTQNYVQYPQCKNHLTRNCIHKIGIDEVATCLDRQGQPARIRCAMQGGRYAWISEP